MTEAINSILIHEADDVATALADLEKGDFGQFLLENEIVGVEIAETIPQYHKFAIRDIRRAEPVRKYGEVIGEALEDIRKGSHVHLHNLVSPGGGR